MFKDATFFFVFFNILILFLNLELIIFNEFSRQLLINDDYLAKFSNFIREKEVME